MSVEGREKSEASAVSDKDARKDASRFPKHEDEAVRCLAFPYPYPWEEEFTERLREPANLPTLGRHAMQADCFASFPLDNRLTSIFDSRTCSWM
jgi:hypothetical protein